MIKTKLLLAFIFYSFCIFSQNYQNLYFESINNTHGLISDVVNVTHQDASGFLWFGTEEGVVRYDGYEFKSFKNHPHLGKLYGIAVHVITSDELGNIFVGSDNGFMAFSSSMEPILEYVSQVLVDSKINDIYQSSNGKLFISSDNGFVIVETDKKSVRHLKPTKKNKMGSVVTTDIVEDAKGQIWVGSWGGGLLRLNADYQTFSAFLLWEGNGEDIPSNAVNTLFIDSHGYLWLGAWALGTYLIDINSDTTINIIKKFRHDVSDLNSLPGDIALTFSEDKYNGIWVGTPYGLCVIQYPLSRKHNIVRYQPGGLPGRISSNVIFDIFRDNSNLLWIATRGGGINKLHLEQKKFEHVKIPDLDPQKRNQDVHCFEIDHKGRLLVGVLSLGFVVYDFEEQHFYNYTEIPEYQSISDSVSLNTVNTFYWDQDSVLWIGTRYNGLIALDVVSGQLDKIESSTTSGVFRGREVNVILSDRSGSILVGTDLGLHQIRIGEGGKRHVRYVDLLAAGEVESARMNVTGIVQTDNGGVLVSTERQGLFTLNFDKGKIVVEPWGGKGDNYKIMTLFKDRNGRIWLGTKGDGVKFIERGSGDLRTPNPESNILGDIVYAVNQDEYGSIWMTTNRGVSKIWAQQESLSSESFFYRDGLQGNIFIPRSFYKDKDGRFFIGGYNGFNVFDPLKITGDYSKAPVVITEIQVGGKPIPFSQKETREIELNHIENDFSVVFSALCYMNSDANQYAYKVQGIDQEWKFATSKMRSANYSNLPPGKYQLKIKGSNNQGVWNEVPFELEIKVHSAPYKTWWAILLYVMVLMGIFWFIVRQRIRIERIRQDLDLEYLERSRSEKLNQYKLRFFTNISHELLTPLAILSSAIENMENKQKLSKTALALMSRNVNGLVRMIRQLLAFRKMESGQMHLKLEKGNISEFVRDFANDFNSMAEKRNMKFELNVDEGIEGVMDKEKIEIVVRNLLSNAFRYTNDGGFVSLSLRWFNMPSSIQIIVEDNGCGIKKEALGNIFGRFYRAAGATSVDGAGVGIGLNLTKSLIDMLNGQIEVQSEEGKGAIFTVQLPVQKSSFSQTNLQKEDDVFEDIAEEFADEINEPDELVMEYAFEGQKTLLLVEDNDDFRSVIREALEEEYTILEASDGEAALELAKNKEIDLIISDIMMPKMSGRELCKNVKSDLNISHIPIILLTAKVGEESRLEGYESGADGYLEKPVNMKLLKVRIGILLSQRELVQGRLSSGVSLEPEKVAITSMDESFVLSAKEVVEKNISDADFSVKILAEELNASNSMLYRKMRSLLGISPSEFIRNIRLKRAAQLLENQGFNISEVAYNCGFNDLSYFGGCFKKMYGVTPTAFQAGEREQKVEKGIRK